VKSPFSRAGVRPTRTHVRILVAEDERLCRMLLLDTLRSWGYDAVGASDGEDAWNRVQNDPGIALLISDWVMPRLSGPDLCRRVRALNREPYLPILLVTGLESQEHLCSALDAGADAFLSKPVRPESLRAQLRAAERILDLQESLRERVRRLEAANERIQRDLEAAAEVQKAHLPDRPPQVPRAEFAWSYDACHGVGGDMFNVHRLDENHVAIYVLDVSGQGTPAALLSVSLSRALVPDPHQGGIVKRLLPEPPYYEIVPPAEVAAELNRRFQMIEQSGQFCTLLYGVLDLARGHFRYVSAGHPGPIRIDRSPASRFDAQRGDPALSCTSVESIGGVPIGILPEAAYGEGEIGLSPGSQLLLYTDGVSEARSKRGEEFGTERVVEVLTEMAQKTEGGIGKLVDALRQQLVEFAGGEAPDDDVTILGVGLT